MVAVAGTSHHGRAPKESGLSPVRRPSWGLEHPQPARRGARAQQARMLSRLRRGSERRPACDRLTRGRRSGVGDRCQYVASQLCTEGERPLGGAAPFVGLGTPTTNVARRARAASSYAEHPPQRQRTQVRLRSLDTRPLVWRWWPLPVRRTRAVHRRRAASRRCGALRRAWNTHNQRGAAHARSKLVC